MKKRRRYSNSETEFIKENRNKMTISEMAIELDRTEGSINQRIYYLDNQGPEPKLQVCGGSEVALRALGKRNKQYVLRIRKSIKDDSYINLTVGDKSERCVVLSKGRSSFLIQRRHYKESFNYIEILMGKVKITS